MYEIMMDDLVNATIKIIDYLEDDCREKLPKDFCIEYGKEITTGSGRTKKYSLLMDFDEFYIMTANCYYGHGFKKHGGAYSTTKVLLDEYTAMYDLIINWKEIKSEILRIINERKELYEYVTTFTA